MTHLILAVVRKGDGRLQQDDNYREFLHWLTDGGIRYAFAKYTHERNPQRWYRQQVPNNKKKHIIVVGAGVGGLSAAYELAQIGHKITILEARDDIGGRILTMRDGFDDGLLAEAGAMRIPHNHFLTKYYVDKFHIKTVPFQYFNEEGYIYVQGEKVKQKDWIKNNVYYCDKWWPGWDSKLTTQMKRDLGINGVLDLFKATIAPLRDELGENPTEATWQKWIRKWSPVSLETFLRTDFNQADNHPKLRPWPEPAIEAYMTTTYTVMMSFSVLAYLRNDFGQWWSDPMTAMADGMDSLPNAFCKKNVHGWNENVDLSRNIRMGVMVDTVKYTDNGVIVEGFRKGTHLKVRVRYEGDAVILTLPLQILRQINIPFSYAKKKAMSRIVIDSATKIALQCKTRVWQKDVGQGGFTKTDLPIGHFVYPGWKDSGKQDDERGILLVYMRHKQALNFGTKDEESSVETAIKQISEIHPEIQEEFETGRMHAWNTYHYAQGSFSAFNPEDYMDSMEIMTTPTERIYVASDTLSWAQSCCSWIQGSVFSALMQAFCFTYYNETSKVINPVHLLTKQNAIDKKQPNKRNTDIFAQGITSRL